MTDAYESPVPERVVRAADADREAVAERIRTAVADGRLDMAELDERLTATYAAKTQAELDAVVVDLPALRTADNRTLQLKTKSGSLKKSGHWTVPSTMVVDVTSGTVALDFTEAICLHREVTIQASISSGSMRLTVPAGWAVDLDDVATSSGSVANKATDMPAPDAPLLRVGGQVTSGSITARYPSKGFWAWLFRRQARSAR